MTDDEVIAAHIAGRGVTRCNPAYCEAVNNPKPLSVPVYDEYLDSLPWVERRKLFVGTYPGTKGSGRPKRPRGSDPEIAARNAEILKAYVTEETAQSIADRLGIPRHRVVSVAQAAGVRKAPPAEPVADMREAVRLYESRMSMEHIGTKLHRSQNTIREWLVEQGVEIRAQNGGGQSLDRRPGTAQCCAAR